MSGTGGSERGLLDARDLGLEKSGKSGNSGSSGSADSSWRVTVRSPSTAARPTSVIPESPELVNLLGASIYVIQKN